jgi:TonB family protein
MIRKAISIVLLLFTAAAAFASAKAEKQTITFEGNQRTYYTFAPEKVAAAPKTSAAPAPLLVLLHGSGRDGMSQIEQWQDLAEKEGLVLAAPNSLNSREWSMGVDGPEFLHAMVDAVQGRYSIDAKRMYLFGHSAGATFALYMGVMESQYFAAAGVHAGALSESFYPVLDAAKRKLPLAIWVGTEDPYFSLAMVRNTQSELEKHGFQPQVFELKGHDHDYYAVARDLNPKIWSFLSASSLDADARWQTYQVPEPRVAEPKKVRISAGVADGLKTHDVQPEYPQTARISHIAGDVVFHVLIDREGNIEELTLVSGHPLLAESAIKAVRQWKYKPFLLNGNPVEVETTITVKYRQ